MQSKIIKNCFCQVIIICIIFICSCRNSRDIQELESLNYIKAAPTDKIFEPDELLSLRKIDKLGFDETFADSSIFVMGIIKQVDKEHGEILLVNNNVEQEVICTMKDSSIERMLQMSDKVLLKGNYKPVGNKNIILIINCEMAQFSDRQ